MSTQNNNLNNSQTTTTLLPTRSNVKVLSQAENGDIYLKVFLLDESINGNKWGVDPQTVDDNIKTAIGKPLVLYQDRGDEPDRHYWPRHKGEYNHPPWDEHSIDHSVEIQKPFSVGTIQNIMKNQKNGTWWGNVKVTDEGIKKILHENPTLPFYVSPQLWRLHTAQANQSLRDWVFMHLAIVSKPAFGIKATTSGVCSGDEQSCVSHFMNASLALPRDENTGEAKNCGFCTYKAMQEVSEHTVENEQKEGRTIEQINNLNTSHVTNSTNLKIGQSLSDNNNTQTASVGVSNAATVPENFSGVNENNRTQTVESTTNSNGGGRTTVEHRTYPQPETTTIRQNTNNPQPQSQTTATAPSGDKLQLITRIEQEKKNLQAAYHEINKLARDNKKLATERNTFNAELADMKKYIQDQQAMARENEIAEIVYSANLAELVPEEVKENQIKTFLSIPHITPKQVKEITAPWYQAFDSYIAQQRESGNNYATSEQVPQFNTPAVTNASLNRRESRLRLGAAPKTETSNVVSASKGFTTSSEIAFERARKLAGMWTPKDEINGGNY